LTVFAPAGEQPDPKALAQIETVMADERAVAGVLCADHHLGYSMPIGGVVAYDGAVSPSGVGFDIACGNKAVRTNLQRGWLGTTFGGPWHLAGLMDEIERRISFGMGRSNPTPIDHQLFDDHADALAELDRLAGRRSALSQKARAQLGTVGAGNHYVDVLADEEGWIWVANHFGSRGLGHTIASGFLNLAAGERFDRRGREREEATVLPSTPSSAPSTSRRCSSPATTPTRAATT
jgi:tRNA-splicing ligase RtcB